MPQVLPAQPNIDWLKKTAKQRLAELRAGNPTARLHQAQLAVARDYGFRSWRALKAHVDGIAPTDHDRERVFEAARAGDVEAVRRAFASGFDPATPDVDGRTIHQIAKERRHEAIELLARDLQEGTTRPETEAQAVRAILGAAQSGDVAELRAHLDAHPDLIDAHGRRHQEGHRAASGGAAQSTRRHPPPDRARCRPRSPRLSGQRRAAPLRSHARRSGDHQLLVEAGADIDGKGDDYEVGVLGWATCFRQVREDVAAYLLSHGAQLNLWTAIALDRVDDVRAMIAASPPCWARA